MRSILSAEDQLQIPSSTLQLILKQLFSLYTYKLQTLQSLTAIDKRSLASANHILRQKSREKKYLASPGVMVSCAISKNKITDLFVFEDENDNENNYRRMLIDFSFSSFNILRSHYVFTHNRASPNFTTPVRNYLNTKTPNNCIGRGGAFNWLHGLPI